MHCVQNVQYAFFRFFAPSQDVNMKRNKNLEGSKRDNDFTFVPTWMFFIVKKKNFLPASPSLNIHFSGNWREDREEEKIMFSAILHQQWKNTGLA